MWHQPDWPCNSSGGVGALSDGGHNRTVADIGFQVILPGTRPWTPVTSASNMRRLLSLVALLLSALLLTGLSSNVERNGPELAAYGNLCGAEHDEPCMKQRLNGGFPWAYLFDSPGISVEGQLSFGEDEVRMYPLLADIAAYLAVIMVCAHVGRRVGPAKRA